MFLFFAESASLLASNRPRARGVPPPPVSAPNFFFAATSDLVGGNNVLASSPPKEMRATLSRFA